MSSARMKMTLGFWAAKEGSENSIAMAARRSRFIVPRLYNGPAPEVLERSLNRRSVWGKGSDDLPANRLRRFLWRRTRGNGFADGGVVFAFCHQPRLEQISAGDAGAVSGSRAS